MGQTWVPSRDDSSATTGPIGMGKTRVGRELIKLANADRLNIGARHVHCQRHFHRKNRVFGPFFTISIGTRRLLDVRREADAVFQRNVPAFKCI